MARFNGEDDYLEIPKDIVLIKIYPFALPEEYIQKIYLRHKYWWGRLQTEIEYRILKVIFRR